MSIKFFDMFVGSAVFVQVLKPQVVLSASDTAKSTSMQSRHMKQYTIPEVNFTLMTQEKLYPNSYPISTFLLEDFPVSLSQSPEQEKDLTIQEERCFLRLLELLPLKNLSISSSQMFPVCLTMTQAKHLKQSSSPRKAVSFLGRGGTAQRTSF